MNLSLEVSNIVRPDGTTASCRVTTEAAEDQLDDCMKRLQQAARRCLQNAATTTYSEAPPQRQRHLPTNKLATPKQITAITAIARRQGLDLPDLLRQQFQVDSATKLSLRHASQLIDQLKSLDAAV